jgi:hypothetical protein
MAARGFGAIAQSGMIPFGSAGFPLDQPFGEYLSRGINVGAMIFRCKRMDFNLDGRSGYDNLERPRYGKLVAPFRKLP